MDNLWISEHLFAPCGKANTCSVFGFRVYASRALSFSKKEWGKISLVTCGKPVENLWKTCGKPVEKVLACVRARARARGSRVRVCACAGADANRVRVRVRKEILQKTRGKKLPLACACACVRVQGFFRVCAGARKRAREGFIACAGAACTPARFTGA